MKIGVVLVTYNRLEKLKTALECYEKQTKSPECVIVVNNNSTDGTTEYLEKWQNTKSEYTKYLINLEKNIGGSGGFYEGLKFGVNLELDWIWVSDDDAFPKENCLQNMSIFIDKHKNEKIGAISGKIINNGKIDINHRRRYKKGLFQIKEYPVPEEEYKNEYFYFDLFSYVGTLINKKILEQVGITKKEYFIFFDDTEHSYRISKVSKIVCLSNAEVVHNNVSNRNTITWKSYYGIRNEIDCIKAHFPKRYYISKVIRNKVRLLKNKDKVEKNLIKAAIKNGKIGKLGLDNKYCPGWKYERSIR